MMEPNAKEIIIRDSVTAGVCKAVPQTYKDVKLEVTPQYNQKEVLYSLRGDVDEVLQKIAENAPIGSRDVLESIKNCRSAIFLFKQGKKK